ncbi:hypothetical protein DFH07DRAFT_173053 [Mycena maculata]|uniref:Uncharacterized protein n=1 Tax=Mycena maculata TaxID=230809 RepID=A0AAD7MSQ7_9AGAR|nr:hypothetical protein DFH07DRAFT_173053 [Mycena maculata]
MSRRVQGTTELRLSVLILFFIAVVAQTPPPLPTNTGVNIEDFQGNMFDLAFTSPADLAPVQTLNHKSGQTAQEVRANFSTPRRFDRAHSGSSQPTELYSLFLALQTHSCPFNMSNTTLNPTCAHVRLPQQLTLQNLDTTNLQQIFTFPHFS